MKIVQDFDQYYESVTKIELDDPNNKLKLRASGFPFCAIRQLFLERTNVIPETTMGYAKSYFTSVGTTAHEHFQKYMGAGSRILGNWECECGNYRRLSCNNKCSCGKIMSYVELEVTYGKNVSGHVDGIFKDKRGKYWVLDYKTTTLFSIDTHKKKAKFPYNWNKHQVEAYCALVELNHGIPIEGWILCYISRDNPFKRMPVAQTVNSDDKERILDLINTYDNHWELIHKEDVRWKSVIKIIDEKPCKSLKDYERNWTNFDKCPMCNKCFNRPKLESTMRELLEN